MKPGHRRRRRQYRTHACNRLRLQQPSSLRAGVEAHDEAQRNAGMVPVAANKPLVSSGSASTLQSADSIFRQLDRRSSRSRFLSNVFEPESSIRPVT